MNLHNTSMMKDFPYLYRGKVLSNSDPKKLGRCKIRVPSIHGRDVPASHLPWARAVFSVYQGGETRGNSILPDIGDIVWVLFEGGDLDSPVYIGGTRTLNDIPVVLEEVIFYKYGKDIIIYNRSSNEMKIISGDGKTTVILSKDGVDVETEGYVHIKAAKEINVDSTISVNLTAPDISLTGNVTVNGDTTFNGSIYIEGSCNKECTCT